MITVENLSKRYGSTVAVHDVSFTVEPSSCTPGRTGRETLLLDAGLLRVPNSRADEMLEAWSAAGLRLPRRHRDPVQSHLLGEVRATVDRLVVIGGGQIVADGSLKELLAGSGTMSAASTRPV
jgi:ABC-2 type transport system ATP-binding protein